MFCNKCGKEIKEEWKFCNYCGNEIKENESQVNSEKKSEQFSAKVITKIKNVNEKHFLFFVVAFVLILFILLPAVGMFLRDSSEGTLEEISTNNSKIVSENKNVTLPAYIIKSDVMPNGCVFNFGMEEFIEKYNKAVVDIYSVRLRQQLGDDYAEYISNTRKLNLSYFVDNTDNISKEEQELYNGKQYIYRTKFPTINAYNGEAFAITVDENNNIYTILYLTSNNHYTYNVYYQILLTAIYGIGEEEAEEIVSYCSENINDTYIDKDACIICGFMRNTLGGLTFTINPIIP